MSDPNKIIRLHIANLGEARREHLERFKRKREPGALLRRIEALESKLAAAEKRLATLTARVEAHADEWGNHL